MTARHAADTARAFFMPWRAAERIRSQERALVWLCDRIVEQHQRQQEQDEAPRPRLYLVRGEG